MQNFLFRFSSDVIERYVYIVELCLRGRNQNGLVLNR